MKRGQFFACMAVFGSIFLLSAAILLYDYREQSSFQNDVVGLAQYGVPVITEAVQIGETARENLTPITKTEADKTEANQTETGKTEAGIDYTALYELNNDFAGWLTIFDTPVDYPVMQTKDEPHFYLQRSFDKEHSKYGLPFVEAECDLLNPNDTILIHGHHMKDKSVFGSLPFYEDRAYYNLHTTIRFTQLNTMSEYTIFAAFRTPDSSEGFAYYRYIHLEKEEDFLAFIKKVKELALYDTKIDPPFGSRLLTLSTCDYTQKDGRFVIVAYQTGTYEIKTNQIDRLAE